jgi:hypothetical protein
VAKKLTFEEVKSFIENESKSGCTLLSEKYDGSHERLLIKCKCTKDFSVAWTTFLNSKKRQCNDCGNSSTSTKLRLSIEKIKSFIEVESNSGCKLISEEYKNQRTKITIECLCTNKFNTTFEKFKYKGKRQCNICGIERGAKQKRKSHEEFVTEFYAKFGNEYTILGTYIKDTVKIKIKCNACDYEYFVFPSSMTRRGTGCKECHLLSTWKTDDQFRKEVFDLVEDEYAPLDEYKGFHEGIEWLHVPCKSKFTASPASFISSGKRCSSCHSSKGEEKIHQFLNGLNLSFTTEKTFEKLKDINKLRCDFYIGNCILVEYDGEQHFQPIDYFGGDKGFQRTKSRDIIKNNYCIENDIPLVRIPFWEFHNIDKILWEIIVSFKLIEDCSIINYKNNEIDVNDYLVDEKWSQEEYIQRFNKVLLQ